MILIVIFTAIILLLLLIVAGAMRRTRQLHDSVLVRCPRCGLMIPESPDARWEGTPVRHLCHPRAERK